MPCVLCVLGCLLLLLYNQRFMKALNVKVLSLVCHHSDDENENWTDLAFYDSKSKVPIIYKGITIGNSFYAKH